MVFGMVGENAPGCISNRKIEIMTKNSGKLVSNLIEKYRRTDSAYCVGLESSTEPT